MCERDVCHVYKRPVSSEKETYVTWKRDLFHMEKRPMSHGKETYVTYVKENGIYEREL